MNVVKSEIVTQGQEKSPGRHKEENSSNKKVSE